MWLTIVTSMLSGTLGVIMTNLWYSHLERKKVVRERIQIQLSNFYGPLFFHILQVKTLICLIEQAQKEESARRKDEEVDLTTFNRYRKEKRNCIKELSNFIEDTKNNISYIDYIDIPTYQLGIIALKIFADHYEDWDIALIKDDTHRFSLFNWDYYQEQQANMEKFFDYFEARFKSKKNRLETLQRESRISKSKGK